MTSSQSSPSFDDIIQQGRQKKRNEDLANEIFGKSRRSSTPSSSRISGKASGTLASRISKPTQPTRSTSSSTLHKTFNKSLNGKGAPKNELFEHVIQSNRQGRLQEVGSGFSIRGLAGPACVVGRNFAPGTTAADIQSAMESVGGEMQSCTIVASNPTVTAEMIFPDKANADAVIATFDNQKADGRILRLFLKKGPPTVASAPQPKANPPSYSEASYGQPTEFSADEKTERHANPEVQDGSYGFNGLEDNMAVDMDVEERAERSDDRRDDRRGDERHDDRRDERRDDRRDDRRERDNSYSYGRRDDAQYPQYERSDNREYPRGPRQDFRGQNSRGYGNDRGLYSDRLYRPRGRGFR